MTREQFRDLKPGDQVLIKDNLRDDECPTGLMYRSVPRWKDELRGTVATVLEGVSGDRYNGFEYVRCTMDPDGVWFHYELSLLPPPEEDDMFLDDSYDLSNLF